jgi:hypothetical protein
MLNESESTREIDLILHLQQICQSRLFMLKNIISDNEALEYVHSKNNVNYDKILNTYHSLININNIHKEIDDVNIFLTNIKKTLACECHHNFVYDDIDITPTYSKVIHYCTICEIEYDDYKKQL